MEKNEKNLILVTGAAGKTGQAVIAALCKRKLLIRAFVHKKPQIQLLKDLGVDDVIAGDMRSPKDMTAASQGITAIYHICPNIHPEELSIGEIIIKAAISSGVRHFVYHSVLHPQVEAMPHHWQKMRVEERLYESGLAFTILQPAPYMQNLLAYWDDIVNKGIYALPYSADKQISSVDLRDVAEVAALILDSQEHEGAIYELCSPDKYSPLEVANLISNLLSREVVVEKIPIDSWEEDARFKGMGDYQVQSLIKMFRYYNDYGFTGNSYILESLLSRSATTFKTFLKRIYENDAKEVMKVR